MEKKKKKEKKTEKVISCLAEGLDLVIGIRGWPWKEDQCRQFPTSQWFPGAQTGPGGHLKWQSGISRMPFWKNFLTEFSSE